MAVVLESLATLSVLVFVVTSMLAMGLSLTVGQIIEPLRDLRLVAKALVANFVLVPVIAYVILLVIPLTDPQAIGLVLLATAAGAPFLPKLVEMAKADVAFGVGLMVLLMVVTVAYVPLVLPLLLPGVQVNPVDIAGSLVALMLVPLAVGLFVRARYAGTAARLQPSVNQVSTTALVFLVVLMLVLNVQTLLSVVGTGALLAFALLIVASLAVGWVLGGPAAASRPVLGLGTAQRNVSAALVVGAANFDDPNVVVMLVVGATLMGLLIVVAGELGRRREQGARIGGTARSDRTGTGYGDRPG
jgi:BASS family bile acid:Na+ symporter